MIIGLGLLPGGRVCAAGAAAATQPIASAYARLNDVDYQVRQTARQALMGLSGDELAALRQVVAAHRPTPAQLPALRQAVTEAVLRSKPYAGNPDHGFLGISLDEIPSADGGHRVIVQSRIAGFVAYRRLQDGDVILAVRDGRRQVDIDGAVRLQQMISSRPAGKSLDLLILRGGRLVRVPVILDALPLALSVSRQPNGPAAMTQFDELQSRHLKMADDYWDQHFAPLCGPR